MVRTILGPYLSNRKSHHPPTIQVAANLAHSSLQLTKTNAWLAINVGMKNVAARAFDGTSLSGNLA